MGHPSSLAAGNHSVSPNDPFATPDFRPTDLPKPPEPAIHKCASAHWHSAVSQNEDPAAFNYKSASLSSNGTQISSIYLEKSRDSRRDSTQARQQRLSSRDSEKAESHAQGYSIAGRRDVTIDDDDDDDDAQALQERKAVQILLFLSAPCVLLSFLNALWTIISLCVTAMTQPVRLCARRPTFGQQLGGLLGPALNLQLRSIYTPLPPHADEDFSYRTGMLVMVQLLSPFASMGMMVVAWIVAVFWLLTMVVGDPAGTDKRDDGRETVLTVRNWWECWLVRGVSLEEA